MDRLVTTGRLQSPYFWDWITLACGAVAAAMAHRQYHAAAEKAPNAALCELAWNVDPLSGGLECAPVVGQDHAAVLTGARVLQSSNWMGLR